MLNKNPISQNKDKIPPSFEMVKYQKFWNIRNAENSK